LIINSLGKLCFIDLSNYINYLTTPYSTGECVREDSKLTAFILDLNIVA